MSTQTRQTKSQQVPLDFPGTLPEYIVLTTLLRLGKVPNLDFTYQSAMQGGRQEKGGVVLDFLFYNPPDLAINVQGLYWHYGFGFSIEAKDVLQRVQVAGAGITLIFIDEDAILRDPMYYVREALAYRDHSRLGRGG